jgi:hypothetical protein
MSDFCHICFQVPDQKIIPHCKHTICSDCLITYDKTSCPYCLQQYWDSELISMIVYMKYVIELPFLIMHTMGPLYLLHHWLHYGSRLSLFFGSIWSMITIMFVPKYILKLWD